MKRLLICSVASFSTGVAYWKSGYRPCIPVSEGLWTRPSVNGVPTFVPVPAHDCTGFTYDNTLLLLMSFGIAMAMVAQLIWTRYYSARGLGILLLLFTISGVYLRTVVVPRLFGGPLITPFEFAQLRAMITVGSPLFLLGTLRWYWGRLHPRNLVRARGDLLRQDEPPDL